MRVLIFFCIIHTILCRGFIRQKYTSTKNVSVSLTSKLYRDPYLRRVRPTLNVKLTEDVPYTRVFQIQDPDEAIEYILLMKNETTSKPLAPPARYTIQLEKDVNIRQIFEASNGTVVTIETVYLCEPGYSGNECDYDENGENSGWIQNMDWKRTIVFVFVLLVGLIATYLFISFVFQNQ